MRLGIFEDVASILSDWLSTVAYCDSQLIRTYRYDVSTASNRCSQSPSHSQIALYEGECMMGVHDNTYEFDVVHSMGRIDWSVRFRSPVLLTEGRSGRFAPGPQDGTLESDPGMGPNLTGEMSGYKVFALRISTVLALRLSDIRRSQINRSHHIVL